MNTAPLHNGLERFLYAAPVHVTRGLLSRGRILACRKNELRITLRKPVLSQRL